MLAAKDPFRFQLLGVDALEDLLTSAQSLWRFEEHLGSLLSMASTTFLELPQWEALLHAIRLLRAPDSDTPTTAAATTGSSHADWYGSDVSLDDAASGKAPSSKTNAAYGAAQQQQAQGGAGSAHRGWVTPFDVSDIIARYNEEGRSNPDWDAGGNLVLDDNSDLLQSMLTSPADGAFDSAPYLSMLTNAARAAGVKGVSVRFVEPARAAAASGIVAGRRSAVLPTRFVRIDAAPWARRQPPAGAGNPSSTTPFPRPGVSLHALLTLGVIEPVKAELFRLFLFFPSLPVHTLCARHPPHANAHR